MLLPGLIYWVDISSYNVSKGDARGLPHLLSLPRYQRALGVSGEISPETLTYACEQIIRLMLYGSMVHLREDSHGEEYQQKK